MMDELGLEKTIPLCYDRVGWVIMNYSFVHIEIILCVIIFPDRQCQIKITLTQNASLNDGCLAELQNQIPLVDFCSSHP